MEAKRVVALTKDNKRILVTYWDSGLISSCVEEESSQTCESCQGDDELCQQWVEHLKEKGYEATEVALGEEVEESLPRFLEQREVRVKVEPEATLESAEE